MTWLNTYTRFKSVLEGEGFTETGELIDFENVSKMIVDKGFMILAPSMGVANDLGGDQNLDYRRVIRIRIRVGYKLSNQDLVTDYKAITTDMENLSVKLMQPSNYPTNVVIVDFVSSETNEMSDQERTYYSADIDFDVEYYISE